MRDLLHHARRAERGRRRGGHRERRLLRVAVRGAGEIARRREVVSERERDEAGDEVAAGGPERRRGRSDLRVGMRGVLVVRALVEARLSGEGDARSARG